MIGDTINPTIGDVIEETILETPPVSSEDTDEEVTFDGDTVTFGGDDVIW